MDATLACIHAIILSPLEQRDATPFHLYEMLSFLGNCPWLAAMLSGFRDLVAVP